MKRKVLIITIIVALVAAGAVSYILISKNNQTVTQNKDNASVLQAEKEQKPIVIQKDTLGDSGKTLDTTTSTAANREPTVVESGASTNINRTEVKPAVDAVLAVYKDFLAKLKAVPSDQRQAVANQYLADNRSKFGSMFGYLDGNSLLLFPQAANVALPADVSVNSAIIDPSDPTQTIVQIVMPPDTTWSMLLYVKMNPDNSIATFERLVVRMNQGAL